MRCQNKFGNKKGLPSEWQTFVLYLGIAALFTLIFQSVPTPLPCIFYKSVHLIIIGHEKSPDNTVRAFYILHKRYCLST
jgi:hypothetical protein